MARAELARPVLVGAVFAAAVCAAVYRGCGVSGGASPRPAGSSGLSILTTDVVQVVYLNRYSRAALKAEGARHT